MKQWGFGICPASVGHCRLLRKHEVVRRFTEEMLDINNHEMIRKKITRKQQISLRWEKSSRKTFRSFKENLNWWTLQLNSSAVSKILYFIPNPDLRKHWTRRLSNPCFLVVSAKCGACHSPFWSLVTTFFVWPFCIGLERPATWPLQKDLPDQHLLKQSVFLYKTGLVFLWKNIRHPLQYKASTFLRK